MRANYRRYSNLENPSAWYWFHEKTDQSLDNKQAKGLEGGGTETSHRIAGIKIYSVDIGA